MSRDLDTAQHEAAHVVVGVALGLRVSEVTIDGPRGDAWGWEGRRRRGWREAWALMYAAGVAWERAHPTGDPWAARHDLAAVKRLSSGRAGAEACITAAGALLATLGTAHRRVTLALLDRDLTGADVAAIARGERPQDVDA
jgi:hypothetical protein